VSPKGGSVATDAIWETHNDENHNKIGWVNTNKHRNKYTNQLLNEFIYEKKEI